MSTKVLFLLVSGSVNVNPVPEGKVIGIGNYNKSLNSDKGLMCNINRINNQIQNSKFTFMDCKEISIFFMDVVPIRLLIWSQILPPDFLWGSWSEKFSDKNLYHKVKDSNRWGSRSEHQS